MGALREESLDWKDSCLMILLIYISKLFIVHFNQSFVYIQRRTNYTCVAYDNRYPDVISSETIIVSVAKTIEETCRTTTIAQQLWPFTVKVMIMYFFIFSVESNKFVLLGRGSTR